MHLNRVSFFTSNLSKQKAFYTDVLGFSLIEENKKFFRLQCGRSVLEFHQTTEQAYYHFAFNIPSFQIKEALVWLKERVSILKDGDTEIIDFKNWNADAIYFKDPVGNILEFIARKNLGIAHSRDFSINSITEISEIGIPVEDVKATFQQFNQEADLAHYWGDQQNFCATGDERGLFILVNKASKTWYPTDTKAKSFPLEVHFSTGNLNYLLEYDPAKDGLILASIF